MNFNPNMKPKAVSSIDSTKWRTVTWVDRLAACKAQELQSNSCTGSDAGTDTALKFQNPLLDDDDDDDDDEDGGGAHGNGSNGGHDDDDNI